MHCQVALRHPQRLRALVHSHRLAELIPSAELHILRGAGHCFPVERELETVALLDDFLLQ
ncbi:hypothetical protein BH11MYX3_BH11MYX3_17180 [soil metagenome]